MHSSASRTDRWRHRQHTKKQKWSCCYPFDRPIRCNTCCRPFLYQLGSCPIWYFWSGDHWSQQEQVGNSRNCRHHFRPKWNTHRRRNIPLSCTPKESHPTIHHQHQPYYKQYGKWCISFWCSGLIFYPFYGSTCRRIRNEKTSLPIGFPLIHY